LFWKPEKSEQCGALESNNEYEPKRYERERSVTVLYLLVAMLTRYDSIVNARWTGFVTNWTWKTLLVANANGAKSEDFSESMSVTSKPNTSRINPLV